MEINKIHQGDCLELMKEIEDKSVDMILCDLPYGITNCKWDKVLSLEIIWKQYNRILKNDGIIALTAVQPFSLSLINSNPKMFKYSWYWEKNNVSGFVNAKRRPLKVIEEVLIFSKSVPRYFPQGLQKLKKPRVRSAKIGKAVAMSGFYDGYKQTYTNYPKNLLKFKLDSVKLHPTQKPVKLFEYLIKTYTNEGDLVLDNCAGSGTTGVACKNLKRNFILMELEEEYCKIARTRLRQEVL